MGRLGNCYFYMSKWEQRTDTMHANQKNNIQHKQYFSTNWLNHPKLHSPNRMCVERGYHIFVVAHDLCQRKSGSFQTSRIYLPRMHIPRTRLVWGAENICTLALLDTPAFNYQLYTGAFALVRCAHAIPQYAPRAANKLVCCRTMQLRYFLLNYYCYFVWGAAGKIYDFILTMHAWV